MKRENFQSKYGPWAIIAGGSQGIGEAFAWELAERNVNLVLLARNKEKLDSLETKLTQSHDIKIRTMSIDLAKIEMYDSLFEFTKDIEVGFIVYNAAIIPIGKYLNFSLEEQINTINVNCKGPLILINHYARKMKDNKKGGIVLISSMAGFQGTPLNTLYAATKAYNTILAEGLWYELKEYGLDVIACQAGTTATPNYIATKPNDPGFFVPKPMKPKNVAKWTLRSLGKKPSMIPGFANNFASFLVRRIFSRKLAIKTIATSTNRMYGDRA